MIARAMIGDRIGSTPELDRNKPETRLKALVSSAFSTASNLDDLAGMVANGVIAGAGYIRISPTQRVGRMYRIVEVRELGEWTQ